MSFVLVPLQGLARTINTSHKQIKHSYTCDNELVTPASVSQGAKGDFRETMLDYMLNIIYYMK